MNAAKTPKEIVNEAHRGYYAAGGYSDDRYAWTIRTFMPACRGIRILEVGCGNGGLLELLKSTNEVMGVDASADGIAACASRGIESYCMDPSSEPLPFPDESFEIKVRNHKKEPATIRVVEHLYRWVNWSIINPTNTFKKKDSRTIEFTVTVPPDGEKVISYTAHYTW